MRVAALPASTAPAREPALRPDLSEVDPLPVNLASRLSVGDLLTHSAHLFAHRTVVRDASGETSYGELDRAAEALGRGLLDAGVPQQEPVAFLMRWSASCWPARTWSSAPSPACPTPAGARR